MVLAVAVEVSAEIAISNADATAIPPWTAEPPDREVGLRPVNVRLGMDRRPEAVPEDPLVAKAHIPRDKHPHLSSLNSLISHLPTKPHMPKPLLPTLMHSTLFRRLLFHPRLHNIPAGHLPYPHISRTWPFLRLARALTLQPFRLLSLDLCPHLQGLQDLQDSLCLQGNITSLLPILVGSMAPHGGLRTAETGDRSFKCIFNYPSHDIQKNLKLK